MAITVGLDFGTHQTKICIENSDDPLNKTYEFFDWGNGIFAFPSVIQINKDHTISYGRVDIETALETFKLKERQCPELKLPPAPEPVKEPKIREKPEEPKKYIEDSDGSINRVRYFELVGIGVQPKTKWDYEEYRNWRCQCDEITEVYEDFHYCWERYKRLFPESDYPEPEMPEMPGEPILEDYYKMEDQRYWATAKQKEEYKTWEKACRNIDSLNRTLLDIYNIKKQKFDIETEKWDNECIRIKNMYDAEMAEYEKTLVKYPMIFRYFKQATFAGYRWNYKIPPAKLSVLFLAYVIFRLESRFGTDFSIQMGVPASEHTFERLKEYASAYLIQAIRLVENVFENDFQEFLKTPYEDLLELIPEFEYSQDLKEEYGIIILPEAYASLRSLTANSRIPDGMSLILDMGGGTTDISFFVIESNREPHIYHYESINMGLNYFLEYDNPGIDFSQKKELEDIDYKTFNSAYSSFKSYVDASVKRLTNFLHTDTIQRGFNKHAFTDAIKNRPIIYTGGGCYDSRMRESINFFTDPKYINRNLLNIQNLKNESQLNIPFSIMSTAFGLSIARTDDNILISSKEDLFAQFTNEKEKESRWNTHQEHGMYED